MSKGQLGRAVLYVEVDNKICIVALDQDRMRMLCKLAEGLSDDGKLHVMPAPVGTVFESLSPPKILENGR